ncbi:RICIN domain-containing protein [Vallitalea okinawensis]|uniref:RICIN domain-containing protein n=1 Tax=Vallitalea okinawensis TaxID=2078660 RepID=UPI000CFC5471|nr:RICIN domain-containing protein [Vallitalea okinawensis]
MKHHKEIRKSIGMISIVTSMLIVVCMFLALPTKVSHAEDHQSADIFTDAGGFITTYGMLEKPFNKILWPGTHNAMANDPDSTGLIKYEPYTRNQHLGIYDTLTKGIRHIDIDLGEVIGTNEIYSYHRVYTSGRTDVDTIVEGIKNFIDENPNEIISIKLNGFYNQYAGDIDDLEKKKEMTQKFMWHMRRAGLLENVYNYTGLISGSNEDLYDDIDLIDVNQISTPQNGGMEAWPTLGEILDFENEFIDRKNIIILPPQSYEEAYQINFQYTGVDSNTYYLPNAEHHSEIRTDNISVSENNGDKIIVMEYFPDEEPAGDPDVALINNDAWWLYDLINYRNDEMQVSLITLDFFTGTRSVDIVDVANKFNHIRTHGEDSWDSSLSYYWSDHDKDELVNKYYHIRNTQSGKFLASDGAGNVYLTPNKGDTQIWQLKNDVNNRWILESYATNQLLEVDDNGTDINDKIQTYPAKEPGEYLEKRNNQQWLLEKENDKDFIFRNVNSHYILGIKSGTEEVVQNEDVDSGNWELIEVSMQDMSELDGKVVNIKSATDGKCIDLTNSSTSNKTNIQVADQNHLNSQAWIIEKIDHNMILLKSTLDENKVMDLRGNSLDDFGNVIIYDRKLDNNSNTNQKWLLQENEDGSYFIINAYSGLYLTRDENNVYQYRYIGGSEQKWFLEEEIPVTFDGQIVEIKNVSSNRYVDLTGSSTKNKNLIITYPSSGNNNQKWLLAKEGHNLYRIQSILDYSKVWDIDDFSTQSGTKLWIYSDNGGNNQRFKLMITENGTYKMIAHHSGLVLTELPDSFDIIQAESTNSLSQEWLIGIVN